MTIHPFAGIENTQIENNIAVLVLKDSFELKEHIDTICLPNPFEPVHLEEECFVTGFGKTEHSKAAKYQNMMKEIRMDLVDHDECEATLRERGAGPFFILPESVTCAGGKKGVDACSGDGGGALICPDATRMTYYQVSTF